MFINHTNHTSTRWSEDQLAAARVFGEIKDIPFPDVDPEWDEEEILVRAKAAADEIEGYSPAAVLCQGEYSYTYALVNELRHRGIRVMAACSKRVTLETLDEDGNTIRESQFKFVQFRDYR